MIYFKNTKHKSIPSADSCVPNFKQGLILCRTVYKIHFSIFTKVSTYKSNFINQSLQVLYHAFTCIIFNNKADLGHNMKSFIRLQSKPG